MKPKEPEDLGIKIAGSKIEAKWTKILESLEEEKLSLECQTQMNSILLTFVKDKVESLKGK